MKKLMIAIVVAAVFALPAYSFAATYGYINTSGNFATVTANTAAEALRLPVDIHANSGVVLLNAGTTLPNVATSTLSTGSGQAATSTMMTATSTSMMATSTSAVATTTATSTVSK
ncbi:MAG: hypothetical protein V4519_03880 [Patescibacteria group bacterium]